MKQFDVKDFLQYLTQYGFEIKRGAIIAGAILLVLAIVYLLRKRAARPGAMVKMTSAKKSDRRSGNVREIPVALPTAPAVGTPSLKVPQESLPTPRPVLAGKTPSVESLPPHIPQESVLRRHYLTHIRYMIETTTFPRPTESVLRRHYEQLIGSIFDSCLQDAAELDKLIRRYDESRRSALS